MNAICSKNDQATVNKKLQEYGLDKYFVFNSINWEAKGPRIKNIIEEMALRDVNVLFIDDNPSNLNEAKFYCKGILTAGPEIIDKLSSSLDSIGKNDSDLSRLKQYKLLEEKRNDSKKFESAEDFLFASHIQVAIKNDCLNESERLYELMLRSNQLNYTKFRQSKEDFFSLLSDNSVAKGYVQVKDDYGDYGIVGFYAIKDHRLIHFFFSCRTLGMRVEQYVYAYLNYPDLEVVGEVTEKLDHTCPRWINFSNSKKKMKKRKNKIKVLIKGPCDLSAISDFISGNVDFELYHLDDLGRQIENQVHIINILNCLLPDNLKQTILSYGILNDNDTFTTKLYDDSYDIIVLSMLPFCNLGVYQHRETGIRYAAGRHCYDFTDEKSWDKLISGEYYNGNFKLNRDMLRNFANDFIKIDYSISDIINDIASLCQIIHNKKVVLLLGNEKFNVPTSPKIYLGREKLHKEFNIKIKSEMNRFDNLILLDVNKYIESPQDLVNHVNHYSRRVNYQIAKELENILSSYGNNLKASYTNELLIRIKSKFYNLRKRFFGNG